MKQLVELTQTGLDTVHLTLDVTYDPLQGALTELHVTANLFILSGNNGINFEFLLQGNVINWQVTVRSGAVTLQWNSRIGVVDEFLKVAGKNI